eukprot:SAG11_NODE_69_length_18453_cov_37.601613_10_plen_45_part_00
MYIYVSTDAAIVSEAHDGERGARRLWHGVLFNPEPRMVYLADAD